MDDRKTPRRWGSTGYIVLIILAILIAVFVVRPIGQQITGVFQRLTDALSTGK